MSNYHILALSAKQHQIDVAFHLSIPDQSNSVGVNVRTALVQYLTQNEQTITSAVPWIESNELTQLQSGTLYEHRTTIEVDGKLSLGEKRTVVDQKYSQLSISAVNKMLNVLDYWGMDRNVP